MSVPTVPNVDRRLRSVLANDSTFTARFELGDQLGAGGFGRVFAAQERETGRRLAVKLLDASLHAEQPRFLAEAELLESIEHPAIVSYVAHGITADGTPYIAMEWLDGPSLSDYLRKAAPLSIDEVLTIAGRVAEALAFLHARGIVHRDIKPNNVIVVGSDATATKVIDLGIAKQLMAPSGLTQTGQLIGTPGYMAPEQMMGDAVDQRVDMFALGCLIYEALTGTTPFHGRAVVEVLARVLMDKAVPVEQLRADTPRRLASLVEGLLVKKADHRVTSADAVAAELRAIREALASGDTASLSARSTLAPDEVAEIATVLDHPTGSRKRSRVWLWASVVALATGAVAILAISRLRSTVVHAPVPSQTVSTPPPSGPSSFKLPVTPVENANLGDEVAGRLIGELSLHQRAGRVMTGCWSASRNAAILVYYSGEVLLLSRDQTLRKLGALLLQKTTSGAIACLPDGRAFGVINDQGFVVEEDSVRIGSGAPAKPYAAVAHEKAARFLTEEGLWEWDGQAAATRVRDLTCKGRWLSPDGVSVACLIKGSVAVDDGRRLIQGPATNTVTWSRDARSLYIALRGSWRRWDLASNSVTDYPGINNDIAQVGASKLAYIEGTKLVVRDLERRRIARTIPLPVTNDQRVIEIVPQIEVDGAVLLRSPGFVRILSADASSLDLPTTHNIGTPRRLAFSPDGTQVAVLSDDSIVTRDLHRETTERFGLERAPYLDGLVWLDDGLMTIGSGPPRKLSGSSTTSSSSTSQQQRQRSEVTRSGDLLSIAEDGRIARLHADSSNVTLGTLPGYASSDRVEVVENRALVSRAIGAASVYELPTQTQMLELLPSRGRLTGTLVSGPEVVVLVHEEGNSVFRADARDVTPIGITPTKAIFASAPKTPLVAMNTGLVGELAVYDASTRTFVMHGRLSQRVTAMAWSRDGTQLAAISETGELRVWRFEGTRVVP